MFDPRRVGKGSASRLARCLARWRHHGRRVVREEGEGRDHRFACHCSRNIGFDQLPWRGVFRPIGAAFRPSSTHENARRDAGLAFSEEQVPLGSWARHRDGNLADSPVPPHGPKASESKTEQRDGGAYIIW